MFEEIAQVVCDPVFRAHMRQVRKNASIRENHRSAVRAHNADAERANMKEASQAIVQHKIDDDADYRRHVEDRYQTAFDSARATNKELLNEIDRLRCELSSQDRINAKLRQRIADLGG